MRSPNRRSVAILALGLVLLSFGAVSAGEEPSPTVQDPIDAKPEPPPLDGPLVALDQLLRLPNSFEADVDRRGGATASEWRTRFAEVREQIDDAKLQLARTEQELDQASSSSSAWQVSAPGANDPQTSPLSLKLRQSVKDHRAALDDSERRLRALNVEADLAAVPAEWREVGRHKE